MQRFLYMLFLAVDANFRMKGRWIKGEDPGLGTGWAYFVNDDKYQAYLSGFKHQNEVSEYNMVFCDLMLKY